MELTPQQTGLHFKQLNLLDPAFRENPYPFYEEVQAQNPIYWSDQAQSWFILSYSSISQAARDKRLSAARASGFIKRLPEKDQPGFSVMGKCLSHWTLLMDPPEHTRHRALLSKAFNSRVIENLNAKIQQITAELLDQVIAKGSMDIIHDLAYPLPVIVISEILGVPPEGRNAMKLWSDGISQFLASPQITLEMAAHAQNCMIEMNSYFKEIIREHRQDRLRTSPKESTQSQEHPQEHKDTFLVHLIQAEEQGQILSEDELLAICVMLIFAGHETTSNLIGNGVLALLQNPNEFQKLRNDLSILPQAIDELLRYDSPVQKTSRMALEDIPLGNFLVRKGQRVFFVLGAANRDPARFENPDRLDFSRTDIRPLSFGHGIHFCPGAILAKLEAKTAFQQIIEKLPNLHLIPSQLEWRPDLTLRGLTSLPVGFGHEAFRTPVSH